VCCAVVDDEEVVETIAVVRSNPDTLAEALVSYNHDPVIHHLTSEKKEETVTDNGLVSETEGVANSPAGDGQPKAADKASDSPSGDRETKKTFMVGDVEVEIVPRSASVELTAQSPVGGAVQVEVERKLSGGKPVKPEASPKNKPKAKSAKAGTKAKGKDEPKEAKPEPDSKEEKAKVGPTSVYRVCQDVIEVKKHRRLPHSKTGDYIAVCVSDIKNRLGCPAPTAANMMAVRRMAKNMMDNHGLRPTHVRDVIETVIAGVFVPDSQDLLQARVLQSVTLSELKYETENARPENAWRELFGKYRRWSTRSARADV
jgi:hypothetical protein